ncbi:MAG: AraC family transcriptional regulator [Treponema sp.]|jgi:AraC-like DNA-binding protein|nr:AraC family transcriptional regulator [Treponema sp.]
MNKINNHTENLEFSYSKQIIAFPKNFPVFFFDYQVSRDSLTMLHHHDAVEIGLCRHGNGLFVLGNEICSYKAGDITIIGTDIYHRAHASEPDDDLWTFFYFKPEDWGMKLPATMRILTDKTENPELACLISIFCKEITEQTENYHSVTKGLLIAIISYIQRSLILNTRDTTTFSYDSPTISLDPRIKHAIDLMIDPGKKQNTLEQIADSCNMSPSYFRQLFKQQLYKAPKDFLTELKLKKAMNLLRNTDKKIIDIALDCGFNSLCSFNRQFKKKIQLSPLQWKKKNT